MLIKVGRIIDADKIKIPESIRDDVERELETLDEYYGANRNVDRDMGGFVVICGNKEKLDIPYFDKEIDKPEYVEELEEYHKMLYISGSERNIIVFEHK